MLLLLLYIYSIIHYTCMYAATTTIYILYHTLHMHVCYYYYIYALSYTTHASMLLLYIYTLSYTLHLYVCYYYYYIYTLSYTTHACMLLLYIYSIIHYTCMAFNLWSLIPYATRKHGRHTEKAPSIHFTCTLVRSSFS